MKLFRFRYIINILREIIESNFPFPPEFGRPKASIFRSRGIPGRLDALLAIKRLVHAQNFSHKISCDDCILRISQVFSEK
jgi:hypothetical protein